MADIIKKPDQARSEPSLEVNFALVLSRMIDSVQQDPAELRGSVYELARVKLKEQFGDENPAEVDRLVNALETAIEGVEAFAQQQDVAVPLGRALSRQSGAAMPARAETAEVRLALAASGASAEPLAASKSGSPGQRAARGGIGFAAGRLSGGAFAPPLRFGVVLVVVVAICGATLYWSRLRSVAPAKKPDAVVAAPAASIPAPAALAPVKERQTSEAAQDPDLPLPATFGIYAVSERRLLELKPLVGKVPDPRVAMSTAITTPTETTLPGSRARFIVFRRDSGASAPDHADVRVIARVRSAMGIDSSGKANIAPARDSWVIRNLSIAYKTGPIDDHPEMYLVQPSEPDFVLPAGRYALVIKGQGFDFEVPGAITDPRQCLERVDALNGAFYSPCPEKQPPPVRNPGTAKGR